MLSIAFSFWLLRKAFILGYDGITSMFGAFGPLFKCMLKALKCAIEDDL